MSTETVCSRIQKPLFRAQVLSYRRWHAVLAGAERLPGSNLEGLTTLRLSKGWPRIVDRGVRRIREQIGFVPPSVMAKLKREAAQIAHVHFGTDAVRIWPALHRLQSPVIVTLHGYDINIYKEWWEQGHVVGGDGRTPKTCSRWRTTPMSHSLRFPKQSGLLPSHHYRQEWGRGGVANNCARSSGVRVVTSARGGATEGIEDGSTGFAFREKDTRCLGVSASTPVERRPTCGPHDSCSAGPRESPI